MLARKVNNKETDQAAPKAVRASFSSKYRTKPNMSYQDPKKIMSKFERIIDSDLTKGESDKSEKVAVCFSLINFRNPKRSPRNFNS